MDNSDYIINKKNRLEYEIHKFLHGKRSVTYTYNTVRKRCSCPGGRYRGYCKHKDWVKKLSKGQTLPENVEETIKINGGNISDDID